MVESKLTYEQLRKRRLEENKKRMEELNLHNLSRALKNASPKPSPRKQGKPRTPRQPVDLTAVRRSSRVADKPKPNYKDVALEPLERPRRGYSRRNLLHRVYASDEERAYGIERAEHIVSTLESESDCPTFVKPMLQSHVTGGFWLGLPGQFCRAHLPDHDEIITLVDEEGEEFATKYPSEKTSLSVGWRGFSIDHNLVDGDALVFQLVTPKEFKVTKIHIDANSNSVRLVAYESEDNEDGKEGEEDDKYKNPNAEPDPDVQVSSTSSKRKRAGK